MKVGGLFSGIGGWELGLERAGMQVVWHCESDPFCQRVLERHWPGVPCYGDVRELRGADIDPVDVLAGGFPCQPVSDAGAKRAQDDERWLWPEFARLVGELRPRYVLVENVPGLYGRGLGAVLGDLAALRYDAEWNCVSAADFGAPHLRERVWIVAYPDTNRPGRGIVAEYDGWQDDLGQRASGRHADRLRDQVADADSSGRNGRPRQQRPGWRGEPADRRAQSPRARTPHDWAVEPGVGRVVDGLPRRVDRVRALGNALVPQLAEWIGQRIIDWEQDMTASSRNEA